MGMRPQVDEYWPTKATSVVERVLLLLPSDRVLKNTANAANTAYIANTESGPQYTIPSPLLPALQPLSRCTAVNSQAYSWLKAFPP